MIRLPGILMIGIVACLMPLSTALALNDPMRPPFFDGSEPGKGPEIKRPLRLSMVLMADQRRIAILNGQSVAVGDDVDGYRVLRIDRDKVVVSHKGKVNEVFMGTPQQQQKTRVSNQQANVAD